MTSELDRFVDEHLTAAAVMVALADPLPATMPAEEALRYVSQQDFDLAVVDVDRLQIVTRGRLESLRGGHLLARPVKDFAVTPRRSRLIERGLPMRQVVRKLLEHNDPLLVVGGGGVTHIITVSDFAGVAGAAVVLAFLLAIDRAMNEVLRPRAQEALDVIDERERERVEWLWARERGRGTARDPIDYLSMGARLVALRELGLSSRLKLERRDEALMLAVRNMAAHGGISNARAALKAVRRAESLLARLNACLATTSIAQEPQASLAPLD